ncbi:MAG: hypothetical protein J2P25_16385 [Nocardiopsaceae bacterium]|nr:hypothetical protein [Nocardiopsaceae bacterium]
MGILGDLENFGSSLVDGITGHSPQQPQDAPVPAVNTDPPGPVQAAQTPAMPDVSGGGQLMVHRDTLRQVASAMNHDVAELDAAVRQVQASGSCLGSFGWSTGSAFAGNVQNACTGFGQVGAFTSDTQTGASKNLTDNASHYDDAESANTQSANGVL